MSKSLIGTLTSLLLIGCLFTSAAAADETRPPAEEAVEVAVEVDVVESEVVEGEVVASGDTEPAVETEVSKPDDAIPADKEQKPWKPAVEPKPISENAKRGLSWLASKQNEDGGWGQGEEAASQGNRQTGETASDSNVADTCAAALALLRSGSTPKKGEYKTHLFKAVEYVAAQVENSPTDSILVTDKRGTRLQSKLGQYVDTFWAGIFLAEVKDNMPDETSSRRAALAAEQVIRKMEKNQGKDGKWAGAGWANALSQGLAVKALNCAARSNIVVDEKVREKAEELARGQFDKTTKSVASGGSAGVELYARGAQLSSLQESANTNAYQAPLAALELRVAEADGDGEKVAQAVKKLERFEGNEKDLAEAQDALIQRLDDKQFIAGFGSNGGEEFLSYLMIGESLVIKGGDKWKSWDKSISQNLNRIQNSDGSWSGHHCITGRTFCTSAALMVLLTDRAPMPLATKIKKG